jgi:deoxyribonuclease V
MKAQVLHPWQVTTHEAIAIQKRFRSQVITENTLGEMRLIAGADIATSQDSPKAYAGVVVLSYPALEVVEERGFEDEVTFPYIPGLLAFREGPLLIKVFEQLTPTPT